MSGTDRKVCWIIVVLFIAGCVFGLLARESFHWWLAVIGGLVAGNAMTDLWNDRKRRRP